MIRVTDLELQRETDLILCVLRPFIFLFGKCTSFCWYYCCCICRDVCGKFDGKKADFDEEEGGIEMEMISIDMDTLHDSKDSSTGVWGLWNPMHRKTDPETKEHQDDNEVMQRVTVSPLVRSILNSKRSPSVEELGRQSASRNSSSSRASNSNLFARMSNLRMSKGIKSVRLSSSAVCVNGNQQLVPHPLHPSTQKPKKSQKPQKPQKPQKSEGAEDTGEDNRDGGNSSLAITSAPSYPAPFPPSYPAPPPPRTRDSEMEV